MCVRRAHLFCAGAARNCCPYRDPSVLYGEAARGEHVPPCPSGSLKCANTVSPKAALQRQLVLVAHFLSVEFGLQHYAPHFSSEMNRLVAGAQLQHVLGESD